MKVTAVAALKADFPLALLLTIANLPRSTWYAHQRRSSDPPCWNELDQAIAAIVTRVKGRYGYRRVHRELRTLDWRVAPKTVLARMRAQQLTCQVRRRKRGTMAHSIDGVIVANVLNRHFSATAPNQKWVTDITHFRVGDTTRYLAPVLDLFDRQIIAYQLGPRADLALATGALRQALTTLGPDDHPLVHTDQGVQFQHASWGQLLATKGATPSMSRKATCLDNAVIESFFGHLKSEVLLESFDTPAALETAIHAYIEWYNTERTSAVLDGLSPKQFRAQACTTL